MIHMTLKFKYRLPGKLVHRDFDPPGGTLVRAAGSNTSKKGGNSGSGSTKVKSLKPRRKAYGPW